MRDALILGWHVKWPEAVSPQCNRLSASLCPRQDSSFWAGPGSHSFISTVLMPPMATETGQEGRTRSRPTSAHPGHPPSHLPGEAGRALPRQALPRGQLISLLSPGSGEARKTCLSLRVSPGQCHMPQPCLGSQPPPAWDGLVHSTALWWPPGV